MQLRGGMMLRRKKIKCTSIKICGFYKITGEKFYKQVPQLNLTDDFYLLYTPQGFIQFNFIISQKMKDSLQLVCSNLVHIKAIQMDVQQMKRKRMQVKKINKRNM